MSHILDVFRRIGPRLVQRHVPHLVGLTVVAAGVALMLAAPRFGQTITALGAMITLIESLSRLLDREKRRPRRRDVDRRGPLPSRRS